MSDIAVTRSDSFARRYLELESNAFAASPMGERGRIPLVAIAFPLLLALSACTVAPSGGERRIAQRVEIQSRWGGLSPDSPKSSRIAILRTGDGYYERGRDRLDTTLVDRLVAALAEPLQPAPTPAAVGITQAWLETHVAKAGAELRHTFGGPEFGAAGLKLFESTFTRLSSVAAVLPSLFDCNHTDDYPSIDVRVSFADGSTTSAASDSQCPMMLPWQVKGQQRPTFNANIARVVVAMMPETATNYGRFSDDVLRSELADLVQRSIEDDLAMLDVETRAPGVVERLRGAFVLHSARITEFHDVTYGTQRKGLREPREANLHASLTRKGAPHSLAMSAVLLFRQGTVEGVDALQEKATKYEASVLKVPWLRTYLTTAPAGSVRISYVHDASLSDKAARIFTADMHAIGKSRIAEDVGDVRKETVLLLTGEAPYSESYWLLRPDGRMILWRKATPSGLFGWKPTDFHGRQCTEYRNEFEECVGAVVSPDGVLQR